MRKIQKKKRLSLIEIGGLILIILNMNNVVSQDAASNEQVRFLVNTFNLKLDYLNVPNKKILRFKSLCFDYLENEFCIQSVKTIRVKNKLSKTIFYDSLFVHAWIDIHFYIEQIGGTINEQTDQAIDSNYTESIKQMISDKNSLHATYYIWKKNHLVLYLKNTLNSVKMVRITNSKLIKNDDEAREIIKGLFDNCLNSVFTWEFNFFNCFLMIIHKSEYD